MPLKLKEYSESDMYLPIKEYFTKLGYKVNGEVQGVDITAVRDIDEINPLLNNKVSDPPTHPNNVIKNQLQELTIIEIKKTFSLKLVYQAIDRLKITNNVYVAVPRPHKTTRKDIKGMVNLTKKLEIGLIFVNMSKKNAKPLVDIIVSPTNKKHKNTVLTRKMLKEINERSIDINNGGSKGVKIMTAYKEKSICIALILKKHGPLKAFNIRKIYPFAPENARIIMYNNCLGWFGREEKGVYNITQKAIEEISEKKYLPIINYYEKMMEDENLENKKEW